MFHKGLSRKKAAVLLSAARSSVNKWCKDYDHDCIDALQNKQTGRPATPGYLSPAVVFPYSMRNISILFRQLLFKLGRCAPRPERTFSINMIK